MQLSPFSINDYLPNELLTTSFCGLDEQSLISCSLVCKRWFWILRHEHFQGWKIIYQKLWKEACLPRSLQPVRLKDLALRFRAVGFEKVQADLRPVSDHLLKIRNVAGFIYQVTGCANHSGYPALGLINTPNRLSDPKALLQWLESLQTLNQSGRRLQAHYRVQEVVHIFYDTAQTDELNRIRNQVIDYCIKEDSSLSLRKTAYVTLRSLFTPFCSLHDYLQKLENKWPVMHATALFDLDFLMQGFLDCASPEILEEGFVLMETAAETKSFSVLRLLMDYDPLMKRFASFTLAEKQTPLYGLCGLDERSMEENELEEWMALVSRLLNNGCSLTTLDEEDETPLSIVASQANPAMLTYLLNSLESVEISEDLLKSILAFYLESLDESHSELNESDYTYWKATLQVLLERFPVLKREINLTHVLLWHPHLFETLILYTDPDDSAYYLYALDSLLNAPFSYVEQTLANYLEDPNFAIAELEASLELNFKQLNLISPYLDLQHVNEQNESILHGSIHALRHIEQFLLEAATPINSQAFFQLCLNHTTRVVSHFCTAENVSFKSKKGQTAFSLAQAFGYHFLLVYLDPPHFNQPQSLKRSYDQINAKITE